MRDGSFTSNRGYALVATLLVMVFLVLIALSMLSLSSVELRKSDQNSHQERAKANARLAVSLAMAELQKYAGPDQRVTARAAILEGSDSEIFPQRNWLGVWSTTYDSAGKDWPLIGKVEQSSVDISPFTQKGVIQDLRSTLTSLSEGAWKDAQLMTWLVSRSSSDDLHPSAELNKVDDHVLEILGSGTLGDGVNGAVLVEKIGVSETGSLAWYISDHSQKASISVHSELNERVFQAATHTNPAYIEGTAGELPFADYLENASKEIGKSVTLNSTGLTDGSDELKDALKANYHDLTASAYGLFTDSLMGGLRYDMTPLLLAQKDSVDLDLTYSMSGRSSEFSSNHPIIPGADHGVLGPSFAALRDWAQHSHGLPEQAEVSFPPQSTRQRPATLWPHAVSDGFCSDASQWASAAPKIHPVMTECRWHYYFSYQDNRIRTHIIPRVCLWNPYSKDLEIPDMTVMMPNLFYGLGDGMHFIMDTAHVDGELKQLGIDVFNAWEQVGGYVGEVDEGKNEEKVYKFKLNPFPKQRYLAFVLKGTTLAAGECHVFSPHVTSADIDSEGVGIKTYDPVNISRNVLSSSAEQGKDHFYFDHDSSVKYTTQPDGDELTSDDLAEIDFREVIDYQPEVHMQNMTPRENFPFVLKSGVATQISDLYTSPNYPTLQLINNGAGGRLCDEDI